MSKVYHQLKLGRFFQDWSTTAPALTKTTTTGTPPSNQDAWDGVASIVGYLGNDLPNSSNPFPTADNRVVNLNAQSIATSTSGGVHEIEASGVVALQGSGTADAPNLVIYLDGTGQENIAFSAQLKELDATTADQRFAVQYRIGDSGAFITLATSAAGTFSVAGNQTATLSATLPPEANGKAEIQVRIITVDASGSDAMVGIDDITVTSQASATGGTGAGSFTIADVSVAEGDAGTTAMTFTVNRTGGTTGAVSVDYAVTFGTANAADFAAGQPFTGTVNFAAGADTGTFTLNVAGDTVTEAAETVSVTLSNATGGAEIGDAVAVGTITNDDTAPVAIYDIQGRGHSSNFVGATVTTSGVVTAVDTNGFYIQDAAGDGDLATSDGIFVFTSTLPSANITVGQLVQVVGTVSEFAGSASGNAGGLTVTQIVATNANVTVTGTGTITPTLIGTGGRLPPTANYGDDDNAVFDPATEALDFYESMEGMLVTIDDPLVVSETDARFGETNVVASGGVGATGINARGGITIAPGDFNPERLEISRDAGIFDFQGSFTQGDRLSDVTGILSYSFQNYEVLPTGPATLVTDVTLLRETTTLTGAADALTVATYNVENLDPTDGARFDVLAADIRFQLGSPDIIGLQEIQDADGAGAGTNLSGAATAQKLIDAIVAQGGPTYRYVEVAPTATNTNGGESNGNIRNGYLYNPDRVTYVAGSATLLTDAAFNGSRKPLVADFVFNGETVTAINVHSTSRIGSDPIQGANQPPANAGDASRTAQAMAVRAFIDSRTAAIPDAKIVTLGDFNGFYFEAALQALTVRNGLVNLYDLLPVEERYSALFEGNLQGLDNLLVSRNLLGGAQFDAVHINVEQAEAANRPADHDPLVARLQVLSNGTVTGTAGNDVRFAGAGNDFFDLSQGGDDRASGGAGDDGFFFGGAFTSGDSVDGGAGGNDQVGLQGDYSAGLTFGADDLVGIEVLSVLPGSTGGGQAFDYRLTTIDANVAAGAVLSIYASTLAAGSDLTFDGSAETDGSFRTFGGLGVDTLTGGAGDDGFFFGPDRFAQTDTVNGGAGANDQIALDGSYTLTLGGNFTNIEVISLLAGPANDRNSFTITTAQTAVDSGKQLTIAANGLVTDLVFNGAAETDGSFRIFSGSGSDTLTGSAGRDVITGGAGNDVITGGLGGDRIEGMDGADRLVLASASESTSTGFDTLVGFDFATDRIDLPGAARTNDGTRASGTLSTASFDTDLATALDGLLSNGGLAFFNPDAGDMAGRRFLVVDGNGDGVYVAGDDYVFELVDTLPPPLTGDFIV